MLKRFLVIALLALFLILSITVVAEVTSGNKPVPQGCIDRKADLGKVNLFDRSVADDVSGPVNLRASGAPPFPYTPVANWRQVYELNVTQQDRQHYTSPGRQIVYAGYFNAACNYVYMDYAYRAQIGATVINNVQFAVFDWTLHAWDQTVGGSAIVSPSGRYWSPNIDATPDNGSSIVSFYSRNEQQPWYSEIGYSDLCAPDIAYAHTNDSLPGSPNVEGIVTGYCDDSEGSQVSSPYLWPIIDADTIGDQVITHVAYTEWGFCADVPTGDIDASSLVYARKVSDVGAAHTGTWEGPYFMDSVYNIAHIIRADKRPGNHDVYYAYLKPPYYKHGSAHPCAGNGHYQITSEVVYKYSNNDGASGSWSAPIYVTDYLSGFEDGKTEPAVYEISAMVDPTGCYHIVWLSANRDPDNYCGALLACKMWHWDNCNNCISMAYDASHPAYIPGGSDVGAWNWMVAKPNISWCDSKLYLLFTRFGTHTDPENDDLASDLGHNNFLNGDLMVVCSDATGSMGQVWTNGFNLTDTESDGCGPDTCQSEHWPTMAMYTSDSLMIQYILDLEPGAKGGVNEADQCVWTDNPVIFMTWPCFAMSDMPANICVASSPTDLTYDEVALAPNGQTAGCTTPAADTNIIVLSNCGNVNVSYTAESDAGWLTISSGNSGDILAGTGPRGSDDPAWGTSPGAGDAADACASPATITWVANSTTLAAGGYTGQITIDVDNPAADDLIVEVNVVVACLYYLPEFATVTGGCWDIDLWSTPKAGNGIENDQKGNITFYACGADSTIAPLYLEALVIGWIDGGDKVLYGDAITQDSSNLFMRALDSLIVDSIGNPSAGEGYYWTIGKWATPDSIIKGTIEYFIPGHQDTSVIIEKVTLTNTGGVTLNDFLVGEEVDWDCEADSSIDKGDFIEEYEMVYMLGDHPSANDNPADDSLVAGLSPYYGHDANFGAAAINGYDYAYSTLGWFPDTLFNYLAGLDNTYEIFADSLNGTEMRTIHRYWEGSLAPGDTLKFIKIKAVSLEGVTGLIDLIEKGIAFITEYKMTILFHSFQNYCEGKKCTLGKGRQANFYFNSPNDECCNVQLYEQLANGDWVIRKTWNYNDEITRSYDVPATSTGIFKVKNNNGEFDVVVSYIEHDKFTDPSNPEDYAGFSMGWDDDSSDEFGDQTGAVTNSAGDADGFNLSDAPKILGTGGATPYTVGFTTYDNSHWDNLEIYVDVLNVGTPGNLTVACADAANTSVEIEINEAGKFTAELGAITHSTSAELVFTAVGSFEIDSWGLRPFVSCLGICGDANGDATVNVSDAVYIINYVFVGGGAPVPLACGDANSDGTVNVSDAVYIINYVFVGGGPPGDCAPGSGNWIDGDCCPFVP